VKGISTTENTK